MDNKLIKELEYKSLQIRINLITLCNKEVIHIGGDLSICDIMTALWQYKMTYNINDPFDESRDRFVLSKGHASAVTSFNQAAIGCFSTQSVLKEYAKDGGRFSMHSCNLVNPYVEISTGSLGHGFPVACGIAAGLRLKGNKKSRVYTIMGDGEQSEGSIWEAALNAVKYKLGNLIAFVDNNCLEADGTIDEITSLGDIGKKYTSFGWNVVEIDGNNMSEIIDCLDNIPDSNSEIPTIIIAHTIKGKGVSFMENQRRWHAGKISDDQLDEAATELNENFLKRWSNV